METFLLESLQRTMSSRVGDPAWALRYTSDPLRRRLVEPQVITLLEEAWEIVEEVWSRQIPAEQGDLVVAAALVLAALLYLPSAGRSGSSTFQDADEVSVLLQGVLATLVAVTDPNSQNQVLLLVRA
ncbi:hypothetical protein ACRYCC_30895 [Actinomadura scrupuli]|uniref:hypothetical protein n=1 Tax=Actinomadura scrupuli TaxID=559629 RepID=UPI003D952E33